MTPPPSARVCTVYMEPYRDLADTDRGCMSGRRLVARAAQRVVALVVNFWEALEHKRDVRCTGHTQSVLLGHGGAGVGPVRAAPIAL